MGCKAEHQITKFVGILSKNSRLCLRFCDIFLTFQKWLTSFLGLDSIMHTWDGHLTDCQKWDVCETMESSSWVWLAVSQGSRVWGSFYTFHCVLSALSVSPGRSQPTLAVPWSNRQEFFVFPGLTFCRICDSHGRQIPFIFLHLHLDPERYPNLSRTHSQPSQNSGPIDWAIFKCQACLED